MVAQRDETPAFLDEGGRANVIGVQHRTLPREFRRRRLLRVGGDLLVAIDELANVVLQLRQLAQHAVDLLEVRDDLALRRFALGIPRRTVQLARDRVVFAAQRGDR
ncbi:MAG: hypothetical protein DMD66_00510 [Gemmatimonadetes bacterium]|nr:MAG: hypothetical protein DMD66_00510 [Gemmatimonadota bacterium]